MSKYDLAYKNIDELNEDTTAAASADFLFRYDASAGAMVKVGADDLNANFGVTATAAELNAIADVSARLVDLDATALTITAALHGDKIVTLSHTAAASTVTLPAATGTGNVYTFIVAAVNTNNHVIQVANATDEFAGVLLQTDTDTSDALASYPALAADNFDTITLNGTTTGGAAIGDKIEIIDLAAGVFQITGHVNASGTVATPFTAAV